MEISPVRGFLVERLRKAGFLLTVQGTERSPTRDKLDFIKLARVGTALLFLSDVVFNGAAV